MAETQLPAEAGVPLKFLRGQGILTGIDGALNPAVKKAAAQAARMYQEMDEAYRERVDALVRADGRVPLMAVMVLYREWAAKRAAESKTRDVPMGMRGALSDTTGSDLA